MDRLERNSYYNKILKQIESRNFVVIPNMLVKYAAFLTPEQIEELEKILNDTQEEHRAEQVKWKRLRHTPLLTRVLFHKPLRNIIFAVLIILFLLGASIGRAMTPRYGNLHFQDFPVILQSIYILSLVLIVVLLVVFRKKK